MFERGAEGDWDLNGSRATPGLPPRPPRRRPRTDDRARAPLGLLRAAADDAALDDLEFDAVLLEGARDLARLVLQPRLVPAAAAAAGRGAARGRDLLVDDEHRHAAVVRRGEVGGGRDGLCFLTCCDAKARGICGSGFVGLSEGFHRGRTHNACAAVGPPQSPLLLLTPQLLDDSSGLVSRIVTSRWSYDRRSALGGGADCVRVFGWGDDDGLFRFALPRQAQRSARGVHMLAQRARCAFARPSRGPRSTPRVPRLPLSCWPRPQVSAAALCKEVRGVLSERESFHQLHFKPRQQAARFFRDLHARVRSRTCTGSSRRSESPPMASSRSGPLRQHPVCASGRMQTVGSGMISKSARV